MYSATLVLVLQQLRVVLFSLSRITIRTCYCVFSTTVNRPPNDKKNLALVTTQEAGIYPAYLSKIWKCTTASRKIFRLSYDIHSYKYLQRASIIGQLWRRSLISHRLLHPRAIRRNVWGMRREVWPSYLMKPKTWRWRLSLVAHERCLFLPRSITSDNLADRDEHTRIFHSWIKMNKNRCLRCAIHNNISTRFTVCKVNPLMNVL